MKKLIALVLALMLVLTLAACGGGNHSRPSTSGDSYSGVQPETSKVEFFKKDKRMPKPDSLVDGFVYQNEAEFDGGYGASYGYNTRETDKISEIYLNYTRKLTDDYGFTVKHLDSTDSDRLFAEVRDGDELVAVLCTTAVNGENVPQVLFLDE